MTPSSTSATRPFRATCSNPICPFWSTTGPNGAVPAKWSPPLLDEAAAQYQGRVTIAKLNVDENPDSAAKYGIRGIPTLMLFKDGKVAATKVGALSRTQLQAFLDEAL